MFGFRPSGYTEVVAPIPFFEWVSGLLGTSFERRFTTHYIREIAHFTFMAVGSGGNSFILDSEFLYFCFLSGYVQDIK